MSRAAVVLGVLLAACITVPAAEGTAELSLARCVRIALENNLDLVSARKDPAIAEQRIASSESIFDPVIGASASITDSSGDETITDNTAPAATTDGTSDSEFFTGDVSLSQLLGFGGSYDVRLNLSDTDASSRSINATTAFLQDQTFAQTTESLTLTYEMPLLRGFGKEVNRVDVLLARSGLSTSREDLRLSAILTIKAVEDAYWDLVAAREALRVARESLKLARDLYELNKRKVEVGTLAPIDVTQAEAGVASREEGVIVAETTVENAEDELTRLLAMPPGDALWTQRIVPTDEAQFEARSVDVDSALSTALERRPEIITARQQVRDSELSERVARNGTRHRLDLSASITPEQSDQDFRQDILFPPGFPPSDTSTDSEEEQWTVGVTYGFPIRNRRAKADYAIARLNREKSEIALRSVEQDVRVDVRVAARSVESGVKRVAAARANTVLQRKTLEAEQKKYENGMSTSFEVLRIQTDLSDAQLSESRAVLEYMKSLADLERAKGTLLEARDLRLED